MEKEILVDASIYPNNEILSTALGEKQFEIYLNFLNQIKNLNLEIEWRFYNDTKTWLGKLLNKNKNTGWLSIWNVGFKVTVFFNEKTINGLNGVDLKNNIEVFTSEVKSTGKLLPLRTTIDSNKKLDDIIKILEYKMKIK